MANIRRWWKRNYGIVLLIVGAYLLAIISYLFSSSKFLTPLGAPLEYAHSAEATIADAVRAETGSDLSSAARQAIRLTIIEGLELFEGRSVLRTALEHLAVAFFVGASLIVSIEWYTRKKTTQEIGREVLQAVFEKIVPPAVFRTVRDYILLEGSIRRDWTYTMRLREPPMGLPDREHYVLATTTHHFRIHNLTGRTGEVHPLELYLDPDPSWALPGGKVPRFTKLTVDGIEVPKDKFLTNELKLDYGVKLPPDEVQGVEIEIEAEEVGRRPTETGTWTLHYLVEGLTVTMHNDVPDIECDVKLHHAQHREFRKIQKDSWRFDDVLLPGQGFQIRIRPATKPKALPAPSNPSNASLADGL